VTRDGSGTIGTANINGAFVDNGTGNVTNLNIEDAGGVDTTQTPNGRTYGTVAIYGGGALKTDLNTVYTNGIYTYRGANSSQIRYPDGTKLVASAAP
jgi:hypothetical protein